MFRDDGRASPTATRFANDVRDFVTAGLETLWITFWGDHLRWAFLAPGPPAVHVDGQGTFRRVLGSWSSSDIHGEPLRTERLAGWLTKIMAYRSTTFALDRDTAAYVVRRINGERSPEIDTAIAARSAMERSATTLVRMLEPRDFELLVDLVFSSSGWRRLARVGGSTKTVDLDVRLPSTGERAIVQVKSKADTAMLDDYIERLDDYEPGRRLFFVYHTGKVAPRAVERVTVIGPDDLAPLIIDAGLVGWLIDRTS
jgi:hypothetical protein